MPDLLFSTVARKTVLTDRYMAHAAHQSMTGYLADWEAAHARLTRQIDALRAARDDRRQAAEAGTWPSREDGADPVLPSQPTPVSRDALSGGRGAPANDPVGPDA